MKQVGIPLFYLQGMGGGAVLKFRDLFNDSSQHWAWRLFKGIVTTDKYGIEANGRFSLGSTIGQNCQWDAGDNEAIRLFIGALTFPLEIITRLDTFGGLMDSMAGLFISVGATSFGGSQYWAIQRRISSGLDGLAVVQNNGIVATVPAVNTLPIWFRIRVGCGVYHALNAYFDYSLDGLNWINVFTQNTGWAELKLYGMDTGIYVSNLTSAPVCSGGFDHFIMRPRSVN